MEKIVYLNGDYINAEDAKVSVLDRGFLFADAIYEVVPFDNGRGFLMQEHLTRLQKSARAIDLTLPFSNNDLATIIKKVIDLNDPENKKKFNLYIQVTRGADKKRTHHYPEHQLTPTVFIMCQQTPTGSIEAKAKRAIIIEDTRRKHCFIKATGLMPNTLAYQRAKQQQADEAIMVRNDEVMEATSSNVFIVKNNKLLTPPATESILHGITRALIIRLAKENNIAVFEEKISKQQLLDADEIFITGSSKGLWPIIECDGKAIADGEIGPLTAKLQQLFQTFYNKTCKD